MELLTAVNLTLPALGEHVVTSISIPHPTLAVILPVVELKLKEALLRGWWFNEGPYTAFPGIDGKIIMPTNTLSFVPDCVDASIRNFQLYNMKDRNFIWDAPVAGVLSENLAFNELPESVATYVYYSALVQIYLVDIGLESVVQKWEGLATAAEYTATQEHLRNRKYTTRKSRRYQRYISALRG